MTSVQSTYCRAAAVALITIFQTASVSQATNLYWARDFNDGTTQNLVATDMAQILYGLPASFMPFQPTVSDKALRMRFNPHPSLSGEDTAFMFDPTPLGDTSARMLVKFSTNVHYTDSTKDIQVGMVLHMDPLITTAPHYHGYLMAMDDQGGFTIQKIFPDASKPPLVTPNVIDLACNGETKIPGWVSETSPAHDWWMRGEVFADGPSKVIIRGRVWQDKTPEPVDWLLSCTDEGDATGGPAVMSGAFAVAAKEKNGSGQKPPPAGTWPADGSANYVDIDNITTEIPLDIFCPTHCGDAVCADHPDCQCNIPFADAAGPLGVGKGFGDGDVDMQDFAVFQLCFTGTWGTIPADPVYCKCFDRPETGFPKGNGGIDINDLNAFTRCMTGPAIAWHSITDCP